jgi:ankyrin repeat protein
LVYFSKWQRRYSREEVLNKALTWDARNGQIVSMQTLVDLGADLNSNPYRGTPLLRAIYSASNDAATWLLDHGADPNLRHDFGGEGHGVNAAALHLAAQ